MQMGTNAFLIERARFGGSRRLSNGLAVTSDSLSVYQMECQEADLPFHNGSVLILCSRSHRTLLTHQNDIVCLRCEVHSTSSTKTGADKRCLLPLRSETLIDRKLSLHKHTITCDHLRGENMALLRPRADSQIRRSNKEPEWSSICNNVFDQYLDTDDLFGFEADHHESSSSNDSCNLFDFSGSSEQSHQTEATSPIPSWEPAVQQSALEAKQPKAKEPSDFWTKTLRALEQNAAESEKRQQRLRSTKSHPDFLSLGGHPSPPAVPSSPTNQSFSAQRRVSRSAANGEKCNVTARSVSRGRPSGVIKSAVAGSVNPNATGRRCSASPSKMMNPSRYRAGFKDVWVEKVQSSPEKYELRMPSPSLFVSPLPSPRAPHEDDLAAFGSLSVYPPVPIYDDQLSPLANSFQQARIQTPIASPALNSIAHASNSYFEPVPPVPLNAHAPQSLPLNDTAPLYPERTSSLALNRIHAFDFGFSSSPEVDSWPAATFAEPTTAHYTTDQFPPQDPFGSIDSSVLPTVENAGFTTAGLGISCDPALVTNFDSLPVTTTLPSPAYQSVRTTSGPYYSPSHPHGLPITPRHRRPKSCVRSQSPSPPTTEPRSRRASSSRRTSRHRRTKSSNATPRQSQNLDKGGFVNFTPQDSNKILGGVAPSGSSKTKARREREAADKRRRLSQAAVRAVVEAGGDLDALSKAGFIV